MEAPEFPIALGVIRAVPAESYDEALVNQIEKEQERSNIKTFDDLIDSLEQWDV